MKHILLITSGLIAAQGACASEAPEQSLSDAGALEAGLPADAGLSFGQNTARLRLAGSAYIGDRLVLSNWHVCTSNKETTFFHASSDGGVPYTEGSPLCVFSGEPPTVVPDCDRVSVGLASGIFSGRVVFAAKVIDLCIVELDASGTPLPPALEISTEPVRLGQALIVSGYPDGVAEQVTERCNVVQAPRLVRDPDQIRPSDSEVASFGLDCKTVQHGSSGSPVFNEHGALTGLLWTRECAGARCDGISYATAASEWRAQLASRPLSQYSRLADLLHRFGDR